MGIHEWSYDNAITSDRRFRVPLKDTKIALKNIKIEVELGFDPKLAFAEAQRCLNCDVQTVFTDKLCIECDACVDICPMDCITFTPNGDEADLRTRLHAPALNPRRTSTFRRAQDRPRDGEGRGRAACTAACAPSGARPARGTCRSSCSRWRRPDDRCRAHAGATVQAAASRRSQR